MSELTQEHSKAKAANSRHLIEDKDKHLFIEVSPQNVAADKAELIGKSPIWVSNNEAAIKELCSNIKSGNWQKVLSTHYYPQLAMAGYLSDQLTLDEAQTALFIYSYSVEGPDPKIEVFTDSLSFKFQEEEYTLLASLKRWYETAGGLKDPVDEAKFLKEYSNLPPSQRVFFLVILQPSNVQIVHGMAILNLYFQCLPTKIQHKFLQGRLGFLSLDEIESSVRKNQRYLGLSYPGSAHFPIAMMDYGVPHDLAHIVQQLAASQETLDLATHLIDTFRRITGVRWNPVTWELIDNPLNFGLWNIVKAEEDCLGQQLQYAYTSQLLFFSMALLDMLTDADTYKKLKCNTKIVFDLVPNIANLLKSFSEEDNIQVKILITMAYCLLNQKSPTKLNLFTDIASAIRSKIDVSKVKYIRKKVDNANELQIHYGDKQIRLDTIESFLEALGLGNLLAPTSSQAQTNFFNSKLPAPSIPPKEEEAPTAGL